MEHKKSIRVRIDPWDRRRMVDFLEVQAQKGWMFCGFEGKKWKFRQIEPKKVHFFVVYFAADFEKDTTAVPRLLEFREYCAHDGWELAGADVELQVFYSLKENPTPIETDPVLEVNTMQAAALRKHSPTLKRDVGMSIFYVLLTLYACCKIPVRLFLYSPIFIGLLLYGGGLLAELLRVGEQFLWLWRAKRYVARHGEYPHHLKRTQLHKLVGLVTTLAILEIIARQMGVATTIYLVVSMLLMVYLLVLGLRWLENLFFTSRVSNLISVALVVGVLVGGCLLCIWGRKALHLDQPPYAPLGSTWAQYEDAPPLSAEEYFGDGYVQTSSLDWVEESAFLAKYDARTTAVREDTYLDLSYTIVEVKWDALYGICLKDYLDDELYTVEAAPWGAEKAFRYGTPEEPRNVWLLCYEDRIVDIYIEEEPTPEQMTLIGATLGNEQNFENNENK